MRTAGQQLDTGNKGTLFIEDVQFLGSCIRDLIRVQATLQGLGRLRETRSPANEPKQTDAAQQKLQHELAHVARLTTMGEFAASIAHEMNQPLGAIVNNGNLCLRLLEDKAPQHSQIREALLDIVQDANRANAIVARVREMTKRTPSERAPLQLPGVIADVIILARHELDIHSINVRAQLFDSLPCVLGDRVQLQQVFLNLVRNSIEAMAGIPATGRALTISAERSDINGYPAVLIAVHDNGIGFSPDDEYRIFEAFYTTKPNGMGMGLRISRSIVEAHGGRLWAKSAPNQGTTFYCLLPAESPKEL